MNSLWSLLKLTVWLCAAVRLWSVSAAAVAAITATAISAVLLMRFVMGLGFFGFVFGRERLCVSG